MSTKLLRIKSVIEIVGLSRSTIYALCSKGLFPKQIKISERCVGWIDSEINDFINQRIASSTMQLN